MIRFIVDVAEEYKESDGMPAFVKNFTKTIDADVPELQALIERNGLRQIENPQAVNAHVIGVEVLM